MYTNSEYLKKILFSIIMVFIFLSSQIVFSPQTRAATPILLDTSHYIIITNYSFYDEMKVFAEWKEHMGLTVEIVNDTEIYELYPPDTPQDKDKSIHLYLTDQYNNKTPKQEYVLLVGDWDKIPIHKENNRMYENYFSYEGWNNIVPDWKLGRWSVNTLDELKIVRDKTIDFQQNPPRGLWKNNITLIASNLGKYTIDTKENITTEYIEPSNEELNVTKIYTDWGGTTDDINKTLNNGSIIVNYIGEGASNAWQFNITPPRDSFTTNDVYNLHNDKKLSFIFSMCCDTGKIYEGFCFGEAWISNSKGGGIAFIGNAETGLSGTDLTFDKEMFKLIYENETREIGEVFTQAKINLIENHSYGLPPYLLLGDPHTNIYHPELVNEDFSEEPEDWIKTGDINVTYDADKENIFVKAYIHLQNDRYSKRHKNLTDNDDFYFEFDFNFTIGPHGGEPLCIGDFNKDNNLYRNWIGCAFQTPAGSDPAKANPVIVDSEGYSHVAYLNISMEKNYTFVGSYRNETRTFNLKLYDESGYVGERNVTLPDGKHFVVNDYGVNNYNGLPTVPGDYVGGIYDNAYLQEL